MNIRTMIVDDEPLARERLKIFLADEPTVKIVGECADGPSAVEAIRVMRPDILFLDIRMPGMDGFEVLKALKPEHCPWTVFVTAYDQHAVRAFEARALDYLLKPISRERLKSTLNRLYEQLASARPAPRLQEWLAEKEASNKIAVRNGSRLDFVPVHAIEWIEASGNYALLHVGEQTHILRETLTELEKRLPNQEFLRVSRGAILNIREVNALQTKEGQCYAALNNGKTVPVTRARSELERRLR